MRVDEQSEKAILQNLMGVHLCLKMNLLDSIHCGYCAVTKVLGGFRFPIIQKVEHRCDAVGFWLGTLKLIEL